MTSLFLEGDKFIGKSTLIKKVLREINRPITGFYVQRIRSEKNNCTSFSYGLKAASQLFYPNESRLINEAHIFIQNRQSRNVTVFDDFGCTLLQESMNSNTIILLDEIGGIELLSERFTQTLHTLLKQQQKIIGVFKSEKNFQAQTIPSDDRERIEIQRKVLKQAIQENEGEILTLSHLNSNEMEENVRNYLR